MATLSGSALSHVVGQLRGSCPVCGWDFALRKDGALRAHADECGGFCDGSGRTDPNNVRIVRPRWKASA